MRPPIDIDTRVENQAMRDALRHRTAAFLNACNEGGLPRHAVDILEVEAAAINLLLQRIRARIDSHRWS